jgi:hypothetical protein
MCEAGTLPSIITPFKMSAFGQKQALNLTTMFETKTVGG